MWIKLFFKHLFNSIRRKPLQPLLSIAMMTAACILTASALNFYDWMYADYVNSSTASYGNATFSITLSTQSRTRFMRTEDVYDVLGEDALAAGCFELPMYVSDNAIAITAAVDFEQIDDIFDFQFEEYSVPNYRDLNDTIFVTRDFATRNSLQIGSIVSCDLLGSSADYVVRGISEKAYLGQYDAMISIYSAMGALKTISPLLDILDDETALYTTLFVCPADNEDVNETYQLLSSHTPFADKKVSIVSNAINKRGYLNLVSMMIKFVILFVALLPTIINFCCFYILSRQRADENELFRIQGVRPATLLVLQCVEIMLYWLIGAAIGVGLIFALSPALISIIGFQYVTFTLTPSIHKNIAVGAVVSVGAALATVALFAFYEIQRNARGRSSDRSASPRRALISSAVAGGVALCGVIAMLLMDVHTRMIIGYVTFVATLLCFFIGITPVVSWIFGRIADRRQSRALTSGHNDIGRTLRTYALKNIANQTALQNAIRLVAFILPVIALTCGVLHGESKKLDKLSELFIADYIAVNSNESSLPALQECDTVDEVIPIYTTVATATDGRGFNLLSVQDPMAVTDYVRPSQMPTGNQAVVNRAYADFYGVDVGDEVVVTIEGVDYTLVISEVTNCNVLIMFVDVTAFPSLSYNAYALRTAPDVSLGQLRQSLSGSPTLLTTAILPRETYSLRIYSGMQIYINVITFVIVLLTLFSIVGLADNAIEIDMYRRAEFTLYDSMGITGGTLKKLRLYEIAFMAIAALYMALLIYAVLCCVMHMLFKGYLMNFFLYIFT